MVREFGGDIVEYRTGCGTDAPPPFLPEGALLLRSGRDALRYTARILKRRGKEIWLPAYCCDSMVKPFLDEGVGVHFYPVSPDRAANGRAVKAEVPAGEALLYMSYFGHPVFGEEELEELSASCLLIEDRTQTLFDPPAPGPVPAFTVASIRKWIPLFDGGYVKANLPADGPQAGPPDAEYVAMRKEAFDLKADYLRTGNRAEKERFLPLLREAEQLLYDRTDLAEMSAASREILRRLDYGQIRARRIGNYRTLYEKLKDGPFRALPPGKDSVPLYFTLIVDDRADMQKKLAAKDIYCPRIWPLPEGAGEKCAFSGYLSDHLLCIPCDQRYTAEDMAWIADTVRSL